MESSNGELELQNGKPGLRNVSLFKFHIYIFKTFKDIFSKICGFDTSHSSIRQKGRSRRGWIAILWGQTAAIALFMGVPCHCLPVLFCIIGKQILVTSFLSLSSSKGEACRESSLYSFPLLPCAYGRYVDLGGFIFGYELIRCKLLFLGNTVILQL